MKKNIIKVAFVAAFAIVAGYNVYSTQKTDMMSDLALANVEALAWPENFPEFDVQCPTSSSTYGNCRKLKINYSDYPLHAYCDISPDPNQTCTYSMETEANRYL